MRMELRVTAQSLKDTNKKLEEGLTSSFAQRLRDSMKKYEPIIEGFEEFKRFKMIFLENEDRFLDFQTKVQTTLVITH